MHFFTQKLAKIFVYSHKSVYLCNQETTKFQTYDSNCKCMVVAQLKIETVVRNQPHASC